MWQGEIVRDLEKVCGFTSVNLAKYCSFYFGDIAYLKTLEGLAGKTKQGWFYSGLSVNYLPFKHCLFEYFDCDDHGKTVGKLAILAEQYNDIINIVSLTNSNLTSKWMLFPVCHQIKVGGLFSEGNKDVGNIKTRFYDTPEGRLLQQNALEGKMLDIINEPVPRLAVFLMALNCKNVITEEIKPTTTRQMRRHPELHKPLYSYHILKVKPFGRRSNLSIHGEGEAKRLHFCRGHFKEFTSDKPLFGKFTGLYWWQPHLRGNDESGFVDKDYNLSATQS